MNNKKFQLISMLFLVILVIVSASFALGLVPDKITTIILLISMGCQQVFAALSVNTRNKIAKYVMIFMGSLLIIFGIFHVIKI